LLRLLVRHGAHTASERRMPPLLHIAVRHGNVAAARVLLADAGADAAARDARGQNALCVAVLARRPAVLAFLLRTAPPPAAALRAAQELAREQAAGPCTSALCTATLDALRPPERRSELR